MGLWTGLFLLLVILVVLLLYRQGFVVTRRIRAVLFVYRPGRTADRLELNSCTGWTRRAVRLPKSGAYHFSLADSLSRGTAEVLLLDRNKQPLLTLNRRSPAGTVELHRNGRYILRWSFDGATGRCEVSW